MKGLFRVRFSVTGLSVEKLLNEARKGGIALRAQRGAQREMTLECAAGDYRRLAELALNRGYHVGEAEPVGLLRGLRALGRRWGIAAGAAIALALLCYSLTFVWQIRIEEAGAYQGEVRLFLEEEGIRPGIRRRQVELAQLRERLEWRLPQVKWVQIFWQGTGLTIRLVEGTAPPSIETEGDAGDVVAAQDGVIWRLTTFAGTPVCKEGDLVKAGQVLIRGVEQSGDGTERPVKARGVAIARVWVQTQLRTSLQETRTLPTGRTFQRLVFCVPGFSLPLASEPDYLTWDLDAQETALGGAWIPICLRRETYYEAAQETGLRSPREAAQEAEKTVLLALQQATIRQEVIDKWTDYSMIEGDTIMVTATAEIRCDIGRYQKNP